MTIYEICHQKLTDFPNFRERRFRGPLLAKLALRELGLEGKYEAGLPFTLEEMDSFAKKHDSFRHEYDAVQKDYEELQGTDYPDKTKLVQAKQIEFGYRAGHHQDIKRLATIGK